MHRVVIIVIIVMFNFVLLHNVTSYTDSLLSLIPVHHCNPPYYHVHLIARGTILGRLECTRSR